MNAASPQPIRKPRLLTPLARELVLVVMLQLLLFAGILLGSPHGTTVKSATGLLTIGSVALATVILFTRWWWQLAITQRRTITLTVVTMGLLLLENQILSEWHRQTGAPLLTLNLMVTGGLAMFLLSQAPALDHHPERLVGDRPWIPGLSGEVKEVLCLVGMLAVVTGMAIVPQLLGAFPPKPDPLSDNSFIRRDLLLYAATFYIVCNSCSTWPNRVLKLQPSQPRSWRLCLAVWGWIVVVGLAAYLHRVLAEGHPLHGGSLVLILFGLPLPAVVITFLESLRPPDAPASNDLDLPTKEPLFGPLFPKHFAAKSSPDESRQA